MHIFLLSHLISIHLNKMNINSQSSAVNENTADSNEQKNLSLSTMRAQSVIEEKRIWMDFLGAN